MHPHVCFEMCVCVYIYNIYINGVDGWEGGYYSFNVQSTMTVIAGC